MLKFAFMAFSLKGKTALVTGAGRGIGRAIALKLAEAGAAVMLNDIDREPLFETGATIDGAGGAAKALPGDITAPDFPQKLVDATVNGFGSIDIIVNNAGYTWDNVIQKMTDEQFQAMLDIHMVAPFRVLRAASGFIREAAKKEIAEGQARDAQGGEHHVGVGRRRECGPGGLRRGQGWDQRDHQGDGEGVGTLQRERQFGGIRIYRNATGAAAGRGMPRSR